MTTPLSQLPLDELGARIASEDPTPGGGSVSALMGALGAALGAMVWRLTRAKASGDLPEERLVDLIADLEARASALAASVDADAASYDGVIAALRLPKGTDAEKEARRTAIEDATRVATEVPLETARLCADVMGLCLEAARLGHPGAVTDAGVGLLAAFAGLNGALYNVEIDLSGLADHGYRSAVAAEAGALRAGGRDMLREGDDLVLERVRG